MEDSPGIKKTPKPVLIAALTKSTRSPHITIWCSVYLKLLLTHRRKYDSAASRVNAKPGYLLL